MMKYKTHKTANPYLKRVRKHKKPYSYKILGKEIEIFPNVMSPKYDWSSEFHIKNMPDQKGKSFLEIGCGSGVISLFASFQGAKKVVAVDINKNAINNTKANFERYGLDKTKTFYSDVFSNVKGKYDTITFAAPYHGNKPKDILEYGVSDPNYRALHSFLQNAKEYLKEDGELILGFSNTGDIRLLHSLIIENKLFVRNRYKKTKNGWTAYLYVLESMKFQSKMQEYIYEDSYDFGIKQLREILKDKKVLKVGVGLGYSSYFASLFCKEIVNLEIKKDKDSIIKDIKIYNGNKIPFNDNSFDVVICTYTLHHAQNPKSLLEELVRVSKNKIVIIEEPYSGLLSKLTLIYRDIKVNYFARQGAHIHLNNYFKRGELDKIIKDRGCKIEKHIKKPKMLYSKEIFIFSK